MVGGRRVKCGGVSESESKKEEGKEKRTTHGVEVEFIRTIKSMGDIREGHMEKESLMKIKVKGRETEGMLDI